MTEEAKQYLSPDQAVEAMIAKAIARKGGALYADYSAHFKQEADIIQSERAMGGLPALDVAALATEVKKKDKEWAASVRADYNLSQGKSEDGLNIDSAAAQNFASSLLGGGGIQGALTGLMMTLKPVKDFMSVVLNVAGGWVGSMFSDKITSVSWTDAWKQIETKDKTIAAINTLAAKGHTIDQNTFATELHQTVAPPAADNVAPAAVPPTTPAPAPAAAAPAAPAPAPVTTTSYDPNFNAANGSTVDVPSTPMVTKLSRAPSQSVIG